MLRHPGGRPVKKRYDEWHKLVDRSGVPTWYEGRKRHPIPQDLRHTTATQMNTIPTRSSSSSDTTT